MHDVVIATDLLAALDGIIEEICKNNVEIDLDPNLEDAKKHSARFTKLTDRLIEDICKSPLKTPVPLYASIFVLYGAFLMYAEQANEASIFYPRCRTRKQVRQPWNALGIAALLREVLPLSCILFRVSLQSLLLDYWVVC